MNVGEDAFAAVGDADFRFTSLAFRAGRAIRPEEDFFAGFNGMGCGEQEQEDRERNETGEIRIN